MASVPRAAGTFTPTESDIEEYRRIRNASRDLHAKLQETVTRDVTLGVARLLNLVGRDGVLVLPYEGAVDVLIDACVYGWTQGGRNLVQEFAGKYAATGKPRLSEGEALALEAATRATHRVVVVDEVVAGAGVRVTDGQTGESLFVMDLAMSGCRDASGTWISSRFSPHGRWWKTTGAGLALGAVPRPVMLSTLDRIREATQGEASEGPMDPVVLALTRFGLELNATSAADDAPPAYGETPYAVLRPGRNDPCPCGSGKKSKRCCWP